MGGDTPAPVLEHRDSGQDPLGRVQGLAGCEEALMEIDFGARTRQKETGKHGLGSMDWEAWIGKRGLGRAAQPGAGLQVVLGTPLQSPLPSPCLLLRGTCRCYSRGTTWISQGFQSFQAGSSQLGAGCCLHTKAGEPLPTPPPSSLWFTQASAQISSPRCRAQP